MGLDVYVGPMARYHAGSWQTVIEQMGAAAGVEVHVFRRGVEGRIEDSDEILRLTSEWQGQLSDELLAARRTTSPLTWTESSDGPYWTDKPDWAGYRALTYLALHDEFPDVPVPTRLAGRDPHSRPLDRRYESAYMGGHRVTLADRIRRRSPTGSTDVRGRYPSLLRPEMWLPVEMDPVEAHDGPGQRLTIGSVTRLVTELEALNGRTYRADGPTISAWRAAGPPDDFAFDKLARFGFAVFLELARTAQVQTLPMRLDY